MNPVYTRTKTALPQTTQPPIFKVLYRKLQFNFILYLVTMLVCSETFWITKLIASKDWMIDEWLEGREKKRSWPIIMYYPSIFWVDRWKSRTLLVRIPVLRAEIWTRNIQTRSANLAAVTFAFVCMWNLVSHSKEITEIMRFEALKAVTLKISVFWDVTPCILEYRFQRFGGTDFPNLQEFLSWRGRL
jgi:hypothetical protein